MITEIESSWRETGIDCPECGGMTYTDGKSRPTCGDESCLRELTDEETWTALITLKSDLDKSEERREFAARLEFGR